MHSPYIFAALLACTAGCAHPEPETPSSQADEVRTAALDYLEGWYSGNAERMERAVHPQLAKRIVVDGRLADMTAEQLVSATAKGGGKSIGPGQIVEVRVLD